MVRKSMLTTRVEKMEHTALVVAPPVPNLRWGSWVHRLHRYPKDLYVECHAAVDGDSTAGWPLARNPPALSAFVDNQPATSNLSHCSPWTPPTLCSLLAFFFEASCLSSTCRVRFFRAQNRNMPLLCLFRAAAIRTVGSGQVMNKRKAKQDSPEKDRGTRLGKYGITRLPPPP